MGNVGDQICFHLFILHTGLHRFPDTFSDVIHRISQCPVRTVQTVHFQLEINLPIPDPLDSGDDFLPFRIVFKQNHSNDTVQCNKAYQDQYGDQLPVPILVDSKQTDKIEKQIQVVWKHNADHRIGMTKNKRENLAE